MAETEPSRFERRQELAASLAAVAPQLTDPERQFSGAFVRSTVALEAGDLGTVERCLTEARDAASRRRHPLLSWHLSIREAADAYARGELDRAQRFADGALELGQRARSPETLASFRPLLLAIRRMQGRLTELVPRLEQLFAVDPAADSFAIARAMADAGRLDLAELAYEPEASKGFDGIDGPAAAAELCNLAYLAAILGDVDGARRLAERISGFRDRHAVFVVPLHVGAHYLAMLAATQGDASTAHRLFDDAVRIHDSRGMPLLGAETRMEWARFCHAVQAIDYARELAAQARTVAAHHRAHGLDAQSRALLSALPAASA